MKILAILFLVLIGLGFASAVQTVHTFAALDTNNTWTGTNTFGSGLLAATSPSLTTPKIGGETITAAPRMFINWFTTAVGNANYTATTGTTPTKAITIETIEMHSY